MSPPRNVAIAFGLLITVIALTPVLVLDAGGLLPQLVSLITAVMLALLVNAPAFDVQRSVAILKPLVPAALLPAIWMLLQIIPLPLGSFDHPIWRSAASALAKEMSGHISIDLGFTLRALFEYLSLSALVFATCILGRNRDGAEKILHALGAITAITAVALILLPDQPAVPRLSDHLVALASLGTILNTASVVQTIERHETGADRRGEPRRSYLRMLLWNAAGALACLSALVRFASRGVLFAAASGWAVFVLVLLIRRLNLSRWTAAAACAVFVVTFGGVMILQIAASDASGPLFAFTPAELANDAVATLVMLSDTNWAGSGVGTYRALTAIYRDASGVPAETAINTMSAAILEWGHVGVLLVAVPLLQLLIVLFRGALSRGRDWFYAAGGASCLASVFCETLCDATLTELGTQILAAVIIGLGLSQTVGVRAK